MHIPFTGLMHRRDISGTAGSKLCLWGFANENTNVLNVIPALFKYN